MSNFSPQKQSALEQAEMQAALKIKTALVEKNKEAARMHLLRIQHLLAQKPARRGIYE
jgi:hypothetical protein